MADLLEVFLRVAATVAAIVLLTRLNGLRSFSKMSGFDFVITVATGSVLASAIMAPSQDYRIGLVALAGLFVVQGVTAWMRERSAAVQGILDNQPLLVMERGEILEANLRAAKMTPDDLYAKLREANAFDLTRVKAVVLESTGDVSVLHGSDDETVSDAVMAGVRRSI